MKKAPPSSSPAPTCDGPATVCTQLIQAWNRNDLAAAQVASSKTANNKSESLKSASRKSLPRVITKTSSEPLSFALDDMDSDDLWKSFDTFHVHAAAASPPTEGEGLFSCAAAHMARKRTRQSSDTASTDVNTGAAASEAADGDGIEINESYCAHCQGELRVPCDGYMTCRRCGDVGLCCIDSTAEWRYYGQDDSKSFDPSRCGSASNYLIPGSGLGTSIRRDFRKRESYKMRCARQYHEWNSMTYKGRNLYAIFDRLQQLAHKAGINNMITDHAKALFKKITDMQLFRGENKEGLIACCMYRACKEKNVHRSIKEIASIFQIDESVMTKGNRCFSKVWQTIQQDEADTCREAAVASLAAADTDGGTTDTTDTRTPSGNPSSVFTDATFSTLHDPTASLSQPVHYVERFCSKLSIPQTIVREVRLVAQAVQENRLIADNTSSSIAAAIIYLVSCMHRCDVSKEDVASASRISEVTIGKCYKKLLKYERVFQILIDAQKT